MSDADDHLERLISRFLDDEADSRQRREMKSLMRRDPQAAALFDELAAIDREASLAMRRALGRPSSTPRRRSARARIVRVAGLAAAACLAAMFWTPTRSAAPRQDGGASQASFGVGRSWFAPPPAAVDTLVDDPAGMPSAGGVRDAGRDWIVLPGDQPGEFLVVEIRRVRTRIVHVQQDF